MSYELPQNAKLRVTTEEVLDVAGENWGWQKQTVILDAEYAEKVMALLSEAVRDGAEVEA